MAPYSHFKLCTSTKPLCLYGVTHACIESLPGTQGIQGNSPQVVFAGFAQVQSLTKPEHPAAAVNSFNSDARWKITTFEP